jgi:hypothetical protein
MIKQHAHTAIEVNNEGVHFAPDGSYYEKVTEINEKKNSDNND